VKHAPVAPWYVGAASMPSYGKLSNSAIRRYGSPGHRVFADQADDSFFLDLRVFDLLYGVNLGETGTDSLSGYSVNTIALQERGLRRLTLVGMGLAGGLLPSPSALVVPLGAIAFGRTAFGVLLVIGYGAGRAATLIAVGYLIAKMPSRLGGLRTLASKRVPANLLANAPALTSPPGPGRRSRPRRAERSAADVTARPQPGGRCAGPARWWTGTAGGMPSGRISRHL
jgi:Domain of unknown function (DUF4331)